MLRRWWKGFPKEIGNGLRRNGFGNALLKFIKIKNRVILIIIAASHLQFPRAISTLFFIKPGPFPRLSRIRSSENQFDCELLKKIVISYWVIDPGLRETFLRNEIIIGWYMFVFSRWWTWKYRLKNAVEKPTIVVFAVFLFKMRRAKRNICYRIRQ